MILTPQEKRKLYYQKNKEKIKLSVNQWKLKNKDLNLFHKQKYNLKKRYGLSWDNFVLLFEQQNKQCKICDVVLSLDFKNKNKFPHVDHCHNTGKIRGLLCNTCNVGLGSFKDNKNLLLKASEYLNDFNA